MAKLAACAGALIGLLLAVAPAAVAQGAPPQYQSSEPERGATLHEAPARVEVTFDQPLDNGSALAVTDACGRQLDDGSTEVSGNTMSTQIVATPAGDYHVEYIARSVAGVLGQSRGHFKFTVHAGKPCDGQSDHHHGGGNGHNGKHEGNGSKSHSGNHESMDHDGTGHTTHSSTSTHSDHGTSSMHGDGGHQGSGHDDHQASNNGDGVATEGEVPGITSSDTARRLLSRADSGALIASLGLCLLLGILGGAVLRASTRASASQ